MRNHQQESIQAALARLLGPETSQRVRMRSVRRLVKQGPAALPCILTTLNLYPEICTPTWPDWPPQYSYCGRLLHQFSLLTSLSLQELLQHPTLHSQAGPVLWTGIIEAIELQNHTDYQDLLCQGLTTPWETVRYAAAMALATQADQRHLTQTTCWMLQQCLVVSETHPVRLAATYALLSVGDYNSLDSLVRLIQLECPTEVRKAALFLLAHTLRGRIPARWYDRIIEQVIEAMHDPDQALALQAAETCGSITDDTIIPTLASMLDEDAPDLQMVVLHTLEHAASSGTLRKKILQSGLLARIIHLCSSQLPPVRLKACCTLAIYGGEYSTSALATMLYDQSHPAHLHAIESIPMLRGALHTPLRRNVLRWLFKLLTAPFEATRAITLDSIALLLKKNHRYRKNAWHELCQELVLHGYLTHLLHDPASWVRQRAIEILPTLGNYFDALPDLRPTLEHLLLYDEDSSVRACAAYACGTVSATWAIPYLIKALLDSNIYVAQTALHTLEQLASPDDPIVVYVLYELAHAQEKDEPGQELVQEARQLLQKWQRTDRNVARTP